MRAAVSDKLSTNWVKKKYYVDGDYIIPVIEADQTPYNPFDYYNPNVSGMCLHIDFANGAYTDDKAIEKWYATYGPLCIMTKEIVGLVLLDFYNSGDSKIPIAGVEKNSLRLVSPEELIERYHIQPEKLYITDNDDKQISFPEKIFDWDIWERKSDFQYECQLFRWIIGMVQAIDDHKADKIKEMIKKREYDVRLDYLKHEDTDEYNSLIFNYHEFKGTFDDTSTKGIFLGATLMVINLINEQLNTSVVPLLGYEKDPIGLSKNIRWRCNSLLSSLYMMLFLDITSKRGFLTKQCPKCDDFFVGNRANMTYCTPECQHAAGQKRLRDNRKEKKNGRNCAKTR